MRLNESANGGSQVADLVFAGQREVIVVDGLRTFVAHPGDDVESQIYLAGAYSDHDRPSEIKIERIANLNGAFVLLRYDKSKRSLRIATDRYGYFPLYSVQRQGRLYLSHNLAALAERGLIDGNIDFAGVSDIFAFDVPLDQRTLWRGVSGFPAGSEVVIDLNTLEQTTKRLWDPVEILRHADISFEGAKDELVELFLQGFEQAVAGTDDVAITLSGGADSRCLLAASVRARCNTIAYSTGVPGSRAVKYARQMAELCGVEHHSYPLDHGFLQKLPQLMRHTTLLAEGMSFSSEVEAAWLRDNVTSGNVMLHGGFAELFKIGKMHSFNHYEEAMARLSGSAVSQSLWERVERAYTLRRQGLRTDYSERLGEQARQHLEEKVTLYQRDLDTAGVLQMLYIDDWLGKVARCSRLMWNQRIPLMFPFAYPPFVDLVLRVRTRDKIANHFAPYLLSKISPKLALFPDSNTGVRIGASRVHQELVHVADWTRRKLFKSRVRHDHQDVANWLSRMKPGIEAAFSGLQSGTEAFDMEQVGRLASRCRAGDNSSAYAIRFLWAWGLWMAEGISGGAA
jgi:asparagine synthase (glutamine-hydrolysing)